MKNQTSSQSLKSQAVQLHYQTLVEIKSFVENTLQLTLDRIKIVKTAKNQEPHIKLLIIDLVNYLIGHLSEEDRNDLISELFDMQQVNDGVRPLNSLKQEDLELKTLKSIKNQFQEGKAANKSEEIKFEPQIVESVFRPETPLKENIRQIRKQIIQAQSQSEHNIQSNLFSPKTSIDDALLAQQQPDPSHFERHESQTSKSEQIATRIREGKQDFNFFTESQSYDVFPLTDITQCELMATSPNNNVISVRTSDSQVVLFATASLSKIGSIETTSVKAMCTTQLFFVVGNWNCKLFIYDVTKGFKLAQKLTCKAAIRSVIAIDPLTVIVGQNDGWFELVRVAADSVQIICSKQFNVVGHVFSMKMSLTPGQVLVCSYSGLHFIHVAQSNLELSDLSFETDQFVNQVVEFQPNKYLTVSWNNNKYILIDHELEQISGILTHPQKENTKVKCWGIQKVADYDYDTNPFVLLRDNTGFVLINVRTSKTYQLAISPITENLQGHGDILRVMRLDNGGMRVVTILQTTDSNKAQLVSFQLTYSFTEALQSLADI